MKNRLAIPGYLHSQSGASLVVVLVLLLVMTLLGLAVLRGTLFEERMSSNLMDRSIAFQAAESALRQGEALAATEPAIPASGCLAGVCAFPDPTAADRWMNASFNGWVNSSADLEDLAGTPQFFIEPMGPAPTWLGCEQLNPIPDQCLAPRYRVTARSVAAGRAQVLLQSNFILER